MAIKFEPANRRLHQSQSYLCLSRISPDCDVHVESTRAEYLKANNKPMYCHKCGDAIAKRESKRKASMVIPINKSTPTYISDVALLTQLNPKRTT